MALRPKEAAQALNQLAQRGAAPEALRLLRALAQQGDANVVHLNVAIKACRRQWQEAIQLLFHAGSWWPGLGMTGWN